MIQYIDMYIGMNSYLVVNGGNGKLSELEVFISNASSNASEPFGATKSFPFPHTRWDYPFF